VTGQPPGRQPPASYEIRVRGHLGATMLRAFPALRALYGVLAQIEALGLELLEVRRLFHTAGA